VPQQKLDLFEGTPRQPAEFGAGPPVMPTSALAAFSRVSDEMVDEADMWRVYDLAK
jgi:hypothetical protein